MKKSPICKHVREVDEFLAGDHTLLKEILHPANDALELPYSLAHAYLNPGCASLPHQLKQSSELYYFINGRGTLHIDTKQYPVKAGSVVLVPEGATQHLVNTGTRRLTFLCIVSPPWRAEDEHLHRTGGTNPS